MAAYRPLTSIHLPADTCRGQCQHPCKRSCRICHIPAPLTSPETGAQHKPTPPANLKDSIWFVHTVACALSAPATSCPWVPTLSWRTTAGRSQPTSSTTTARSCCSSLGWLSMTENSRALKSQTNTPLSSSSRTRKDRGQVVIWTRPQMGSRFSFRSPGLYLRCQEDWRSLWGLLQRGRNPPLLCSWAGSWVWHELVNREHANLVWHCTLIWRFRMCLFHCCC